MDRRAGIPRRRRAELTRVFAFALAAWLCAGLAGAASPPYRYDGVQRIVAFADVHGAYQELLAVLRETAVVDESLRWRSGATHLVSLGDLLDRGPDSRKVLELLMRLADEARAAGGALHVVLGNHEVMNIAGDLRYVNAAEYQAFAGSDDDALREAAWEQVRAQDAAALRADFDLAYPPGYFAHRQAFSPAGRYGAWLLSRPFLITINDTAFVHAGLPAMVARLGLDATNETLHAELAGYLRTWESVASELALARPVAFLEQPDTVAGRGAVPQAEALRKLQEEEVFTPAGPTWFRGQALCHPYTETENLNSALERLGVARVVVGHTVVPGGRVQSRFNGRVTLLDTGMLQEVYHGSPAAFVFEDGRWTVAYADRPGQRLEPEVPPRAVGTRPRGLDDDALEQWLAQAEIQNVEDLDTGITEPRRVTLRKDGVELRAVFKYLSTDFGATSRMRALNEADRFEYELAAYRLDRLIGLDLVPVTVPRTVNGKRGVLQFWIDGSINLRQMLAQQLQPSGWCEAEPQYNLMNVFDVLIHNTDRTQENALFTRDWMLVLIDHTRAFALHPTNPPLLYRGGLRVPPAFAARLAGLDRATLETALGAYLRPRQIDAILKRRDRLLDLYRAGAEAGKRAAP